MSHFIRKANTFSVTDSTDIHDRLPVGNYSVRHSDMMGMYLEQIDSFSMPSRLYGTIEDDANRIFDTFQARKQSTGVLLVGEKGSGKTLLAKRLSVLCAQAGAPSIVVNAAFRGDEFNKLIQSINHEALVLFDEFEKIYNDDNGRQDAILTLLDGVYPTKKLFVLTCNDKWAINNNLWNRPGRVYYSLSFKGLDRSFIKEYCDINLKYNNRMEEVLMITNMFPNINFDMLQSLIEETNRYNESPKQLLRMLNLKVEFERDNTYNIHIKIRGFPVHQDILNTKQWTGNPLNMEGDDIHVSIRVPKTMMRANSIDIDGLIKFYSEDNNPESLNGKFESYTIYFSQNDICGYNKTGSIQLRNKFGYEISLTPELRTNSFTSHLI